MIDDLLKESSVAQAFFEEGEREGERQMALIAIEGRYGPLSDDLRTAINAADEAMLRQIVAQIATLTLEELQARLGL